MNGGTPKGRFIMESHRNGMRTGTPISGNLHFRRGFSISACCGRGFPNQTWANKCGAAGHLPGKQLGNQVPNQQ